MNKLAWAAGILMAVSPWAHALETTPKTDKLPVNAKIIFAGSQTNVAAFLVQDLRTDLKLVYPIRIQYAVGKVEESPE